MRVARRRGPSHPDADLRSRRFHRWLCVQMPEVAHSRRLRCPRGARDEPAPDVDRSASMDVRAHVQGAAADRNIAARRAHSAGAMRRHEQHHQTHQRRCLRAGNIRRVSSSPTLDESLAPQVGASFSMKPDSVICPSCGAEWQLTTIEMVRHRGPLWCVACVERADARLVEALRRHPQKDAANRSSGVEGRPSGGH
ncbi:hypothetical protein B0G73_105197 [Paraburkholderia sp. BL25I1N1]|nr:hypothetical protein B0G73_105197 [Paraburkholderia sp. BL25I1N1]